MLVRSLVKLSTLLPYYRFIDDTENPQKARSRVWNQTLREILNAPFWVQKGISSASILNDFEITDYEFYRQSIEESFSDGVSRLSGKPVLFWSESSGSTGKRKLFPITLNYKKQFQTTTPPLLNSFIKRFPLFLRKPVLYFAATMPCESSPSGIDVGFISNYNYRNIPKPLQKHYAFPIEVFKNTQTFFEWGPLYALATDLSAMIAITPSMIQQFQENILRNMPKYWPILEGQAQPPDFLPKISISPERLATLRAAFKGHPIQFKKIWPSLQFICCWKSSTCGMQLPLIQPYLVGVPVIDATYSATEGWMTVPMETDQIGGPLHPGGHIVEFFKEGDTPSKSSILQSWELKPGEDYEILLTTTMGFIRYRLYDIVRCKGFFNRSPILEFRQKSGKLISLGQTRITETLLLEAVNDAKVKWTGRWTFGPNDKGNQLVLYSNSTANFDVNDLKKIDSFLCSKNPEYASDTQTGLLKPLGSQFLADTHGIWQVNAHAQSKQSILLKTAP